MPQPNFRNLFCLVFIKIPDFLLQIILLHHFEFWQAHYKPFQLPKLFVICKQDQLNSDRDHLDLLMNKCEMNRLQILLDM